MTRATVKHPKDRKRGDAVLLTGKQARQIVTLLGKLQDSLESAIDSCLLEGETQPRDARLKPFVKHDRRDWKRAEDLIKTLTQVSA